MVRVFWLIGLLLTSPLYAATLQLQLDKTQVELGKFVTAKIIYRGDKAPGPIDLSQWQNDFFIDRNDAEISTTRDGKIELEISARLYPRKSGERVLDAIALGGAIARPAHVRVLAAIRNHIDLTPRLQTLKDFYWADQAIEINVDVPLQDARNEVVAEDFSAEHFDISRLPDERIKTDQGESIRLRWMLLSPRPGQYKIELPSIVQRGRGRFRFYLPLLELHIKPLPAYLSPSMIVGRPELNMEVEDDKRGRRFLHINIANQGRLPQQPQGLGEFVERLGVDEFAIDTLQQTKIGNATLQYRIELPRWFLPQRPLLELGYFDTEQGRYDELRQPAPLLWNTPHFVLWAGIFLGIFLLFYALNRLDHLAGCWRHRQGLRRQIQQCDSAKQLRRLLLNDSGHRSLQHWSQQFEQASAQEIAQRLNRACFGAGAQPDLDRIRQACLKLV